MDIFDFGLVVKDLEDVDGGGDDEVGHKDAASGTKGTANEGAS